MCNAVDGGAERSPRYSYNCGKLSSGKTGYLTYGSRGLDLEGVLPADEATPAAHMNFARNSKIIAAKADFSVLSPSLK